MDPFPSLALVVIAGPQASGKSTVAAALAQDLRTRGERVALVELDQIAAMALPTLPSWQTAHQIFEMVTGLWARSELTCVIAEGSGDQSEVSRLLGQAPAAAAVITVVTTVPFDVAFARAQVDPTRGVSKEHDFLRRVFDRWPDEMARIDPDVLLDTNDCAIDESVERIRAAIGSARQSAAVSGPADADASIRAMRAPGPD